MVVVSIGGFVSAVSRQLSDLNPDDAKFAEAAALIETAPNRVYQAINSELVTLHWQLGEGLSQKIENANSEYERGDARHTQGDLVVKLGAERARRRTWISDRRHSNWSSRTALPLPHLRRATAEPRRRQAIESVGPINRERLHWSSNDRSGDPRCDHRVQLEAQIDHSITRLDVQRH